MPLATAPFTALRASGRLILMMANGPRFSYSTDMAGTIATSRYPPGSGRTTRAPAVPVLRGVRGRAPLPGVAAARLLRLCVLRRPLGRGSRDRRVPRSLLRARRPAAASLELVARLRLAVGARLRLALSRLRAGGAALRLICGGDPRTPCGF